jgi:hypothetical protein
MSSASGGLANKRSVSDQNLAEHHQDSTEAKSSSLSSSRKDGFRNIVLKISQTLALTMQKYVFVIYVQYVLTTRKERHKIFTLFRVSDLY